MARLRVLKPRTRYPGPRLKVARVEAIDPASATRRQLYMAPRWKAVTNQFAGRPCIVCGSRERIEVDHVLGHDDVTAHLIATDWNIPISPDWRSRFHQGPLAALCRSCHSSKTAMETRGRLAEWIERHAETLGLRRI